MVELRGRFWSTAGMVRFGLLLANALLIGAGGLNAQMWDGGGLRAPTDTRGINPVNQIAAAGYSNNDTAWQSFDLRIRPASEPSTCGYVHDRGCQTLCLASPSLPGFAGLNFTAMNSNCVPFLRSSLLL